MGLTQSTTVPDAPLIPVEAYTCQYKKEEFNKLLNIIRDAHEVCKFYSQFLLLQKVPIRLEEYKTYSDSSEEFFNKTRKIILPELGMSYYTFYNYLNVLQKAYENPDVTENEKRKMLTDIFNNAYIVQKLFIEDLCNTCDTQNGFTTAQINDILNPPVQPESTSNL
jgi:hypothetical protein